ncbi:MAG: type II secretion system F family protein [Armatimonadota bacterium]
MPVAPLYVEEHLSLVLFTRQFATLVSAGMSIMRSLSLIEEQVPPPFGPAARTLCNCIEKGETLTEAMVSLPDLFSPAYRAFIQGGELGGILDLSLLHLANLLDEEWQIARVTHRGDIHSTFFLPLTCLDQRGWQDLNEDEQTLLLLLFSRTFGTLLNSGVPILQSLSLAAELLPAEQREAVLAVRQAVREGKRLCDAFANPRFSPRLIVELATLGENTGSLDQAMLKAAEIYRHQLSCRRSA